MRVYFCVVAATIIAAYSYEIATKMIWNARPLNPELAYEALEAKLKPAGAGRHLFDLSEATRMERGDELIFFGRGRVRSADTRKYSMPIIESYDFQYIAVMRRICHEWRSDCYAASDIEITGKKAEVPMI